MSTVGTKRSEGREGKGKGVTAEDWGKGNNRTPQWGSPDKDKGSNLDESKKPSTLGGLE